MPTITARAIARANLAAILSENGAGATLADLSRSLYKYTDAGISLAAKQWDGTPIWNGTPGMRTVALGDVSHLGLSSIVEGSDAEVPVSWIDLTLPDAPARPTRRQTAAVLKPAPPRDASSYVWV